MPHGTTTVVAEILIYPAAETGAVPLVNQRFMVIRQDSRRFLTGREKPFSFSMLWQRTTRVPYPVFVPEAGELQLLTTTGPSWACRRISRASRGPSYLTAKAAEMSSPRPAPHSRHGHSRSESPCRQSAGRSVTATSGLTDFHDSSVYPLKRARRSAIVPQAVGFKLPTMRGIPCPFAQGQSLTTRYKSDHAGHLKRAAPFLQTRNRPAPWRTPPIECTAGLSIIVGALHTADRESPILDVTGSSDTLRHPWQTIRGWANAD